MYVRGPDETHCSRCGRPYKEIRRRPGRGTAYDQNLADAEREVRELEQQVERLTKERNGLMAGLKETEQYVIDTREALKLRDCVKCGICGFEISPLNPSEGFCWNCRKHLTVVALKETKG